MDLSNNIAQTFVVSGKTMKTWRSTGLYKTNLHRNRFVTPLKTTHGKIHYVFKLSFNKSFMYYELPKTKLNTRFNRGAVS